MKKIQVSTDQFIPFGELIRGFANQINLSKGDLKRVLRNRGVFLSNSEKEQMVPFLTTVLLSPNEYDDLRESQNTREDTLKKSSSRIEWNSSSDLIEAIPQIFTSQQLNIGEYSNYRLKSPAQAFVVDGDRNKVRIDFGIERFDLNKSWYESHNEFSGGLYIEKISESEIQIVKTFTSSETEEVGNRLQQYVVKKCKEGKFIDDNKELEKILFSSFDNETRIVFFFRLSKDIQNQIFTFSDLVDIQFGPDESVALPAEIDWMSLKDQLIIKGKELHNTFFIKDKVYHKFLKVWGVEAKYKFLYLGINGNLTVSFEFSNFTKNGMNSEFEIKIVSINFNSLLDTRQKEQKKRQLLDILEKQKNDIYQNYMSYLKASANPSLQSSI